MGLTFSLLYLDQYRTIEKKLISFDQRYVFDAESGEISRSARSGTAGEFFYGSKVRTMSCLVGRNGEGKSSLVEFLRDSFILILEKVAGNKREFEADGKLLLSENELLYYHLEMATRFLVIFRLDEKDYYVTNLEKIKGPAGCQNVRDAKISGISKVRFAWFSAMRLPADVSRSELCRDRRGIGLSDSESFEEILQNHIIDLSEESMNDMRTDSPERNRLNWDVLMQIAFFSGGDEKLLKEILGEHCFEKIQIDSVEFGSETFTVNKLISEAKKGKAGSLERAITDTKAYLRPFSSGQYSRFSFLARLYWCLGGGRSFCESEVGKKMIVRLEDVDKEWLTRYMFDSSETPVLLMDESDLYYHPEWQRSYMKDILGMVADSEANNVQIIFTTNSAFMLSDMLKEDVAVLSPEDGKSRLDDRTFGQNIHTLLARPFFMESTIGASAEETIRWLLKLLKTDNKEDIEKSVKEKYSAWFEAHQKQTEKEVSADEFLKRLIDSIGEELIRHRLVYLYEEYMKYMKEKRRKKSKLENALAYLEEIENADDNVRNAIAEIKKAKGET